MREEDNGSPWLSPPQALEEEGKKKKSTWKPSIILEENPSLQKHVH